MATITNKKMSKQLAYALYENDLISETNFKFESGTIITSTLSCERYCNDEYKVTVCFINNEIFQIEIYDMEIDTFTCYEIQ